MPQMFPSPLIILFIYFLSLMLVMTTSVYFTKTTSLINMSLPVNHPLFHW